jgi:pyruvate/2-oxoglutarate dehydrogenase complex dihydrolipoamide acyltransferase (E2) component
MSRMRMRTAERLKESQNTAAFLTTFNEVDMSRAMTFRASETRCQAGFHGPGGAGFRAGPPRDPGYKCVH